MWQQRICLFWQGNAMNDFWHFENPFVFGLLRKILVLNACCIFSCQIFKGILRMVDFETHDGKSAYRLVTTVKSMNISLCFMAYAAAVEPTNARVHQSHGRWTPFAYINNWYYFRFDCIFPVQKAMRAFLAPCSFQPSETSLAPSNHLKHLFSELCMLQLYIAFTRQECLNSSKDWVMVIELNDRCKPSF